MTTVIYHKADYDGIFCREIAKLHLPTATLIGWGYNDPEPLILPDQELFILDLSVPSLMNHSNLVWIDHHKTAIDKYSSHIRGLRIDGVAACRLAWQWFRNNPNPTFSQFRERTVLEPWSVRLAGEYDIWDKRDSDAELFQHGLRSEELDWTQMFECNHEGYIRRLLNQGRALQYARTKENESIIKAQGFNIAFEGLKFIALNTARCNSFSFAAAITSEHDGCLGFNWTGKQWRVSLYGVPHKPEQDLSIIATKYGGGGHKQACGFVVDHLPFLS